MGYERTHSFQKKSTHTSQPTTQFGSRPCVVPVQMKPKEQMTPEELEKEAFNQHKFEAFELQLKEKSGTITPVEQERLGVLQAKMDDFWAQRRERGSRFSYDFSMIPVHQPEGYPTPRLQPMWRQRKNGVPREDDTAVINTPQPLLRLPIQAKLTIGEPGDKYEQEADAVAVRVVEQIHAPATAQSTPGQSIQRQAEEEIEEVRAKPEISALQRMDEPNEEEIQGKFIQKEGEAKAGGEAATDLDSAINSARGGGQPLDAGLQQSMGQAMGADFSGVRVHTDAQADELNQSIQAKAFTTGQDVFFRQGVYEPGSRGGQELIAHELTHVVQQNGGVVRQLSSQSEQFPPHLTTESTTSFDHNDMDKLVRDKQRHKSNGLFIGLKQDREEPKIDISRTTPAGEQAQIQLLKDWRSFRPTMVKGTKRALKSYVLYLQESMNEARSKVPSDKVSGLTEKQKQELISYQYQLTLASKRIENFPDDEKDAPKTNGQWTVLNAGVDNVKAWLKKLDEFCKKETGNTYSTEIRETVTSLEELQGMIDYFYEIATTQPEPTPRVEATKEKTIKLYRRMWRGEAELIMKNKKVKDAMGVNDNYKKYFTTSIDHTEHFSNANSKAPDDEVIVEFEIDWKAYWDFVKTYGVPNQKKGSLDDKKTAIMNQERIVKGNRANFRIQAQVKNVIESKEHHNIGIGQGNVDAFDKIIKRISCSSSSFTGQSRVGNGFRR